MSQAGKIVDSVNNEFGVDGFKNLLVATATDRIEAITQLEDLGYIRESHRYCLPNIKASYATVSSVDDWMLEALCAKSTVERASKTLFESFLTNLESENVEEYFSILERFFDGLLRGTVPFHVYLPSIKNRMPFYRHDKK
ncbi:hypothetical protein GOV04_02760 [Candidatus Woesearchaeota archaeon]|nr:hypothetical protein [Candidatus Woesearchaeota archaeon]